MSNTPFRDDWDRKAHDIICIVKYGAPGGSVATKDMQRVSDILRGGSFKQPVVVPPLPRALVIEETLKVVSPPVIVPPLPPKVT